MNQQPNSNQLPNDIAEVAGFLAAMIPELPEAAGEAIHDWLIELREGVRSWRMGDAEPDWVSFREWCNDICRDDGMPLLFAATLQVSADSAVVIEDEVMP